MAWLSRSVFETSGQSCRGDGFEVPAPVERDHVLRVARGEPRVDVEPGRLAAEQPLEVEEDRAGVGVARLGQLGQRLGDDRRAAVADRRVERLQAGGGSLRCIAITTSGESPTNGGRPASRWKRVAPIA